MEVKILDKGFPLRVDGGKNYGDPLSIDGCKIRI